MGDNCHLLCEPLNVLSLLRDEGKRNEERKVEVLVASLFDALVEKVFDAFPDPVTVWANDHAAPHGRVNCKISLSHHFLVPFREVLLPAWRDCGLRHVHVLSQSTALPSPQNHVSSMAKAWSFAPCYLPKLETRIDRDPEFQTC